jgi:hypothetical protein
MGFFSGRVACCRYRVTGRSLSTFHVDHVEKLAGHAIGKQRIATGDGSQAGWIAGDHILDTRFDIAKNIVHDTLQFALRLDEHRIPGDLLRAYTQVELEGLTASNGSGRASGRQKREARMLAKERLEKEAGDGRYLRRKAVPLLWDAPSGELIVAGTSVTALDRLHPLFKATFERGLEPLGAGRQAFAIAEATNRARAVDDAQPTVFVPGQTPAVAWTPDESDRDFLGNEFVLWLWFYLENESDTIPLVDGSEVAAMLARTLVLECPRGQTGRESISSDSPGKLPEALRAIQSGKLPRKAGLTLVRHKAQYELTLHAESLAITGARLPTPEGDDERAIEEERVTQLRNLLETLDLLYGTFLQRRLGDPWTKEAARMKKWLTHA